MEKLLRGPVFVLDDKAGIEDSGDKINEIINFLDENSFPCVVRDSIPDDPPAFIENLKSFSFLLLDWDINGLSLADQLGVDTQHTELGAEILEFIKEIKGSVFCPIFIFSNNDPDVILDKLIEQDIIKNKDESGHVFVHSKNTVVKGDILSIAKDWLSKSPSAYVLRAWDSEYQEARVKLFGDFFDKSEDWPKILWDIFSNDGQEPSMDLGDLISRNLATRMAPFEFDDEILKDAGEPDINDLQSVLYGARFIPVDRLHGDSNVTGDIYKKIGASDRFIINIRPICDTSIRPTDGADIIADKKNIYGISGKKEKVYRDKIGKGGSYQDKLDQAYVPCLASNGKKGINFYFSKLKIIIPEDQKYTKVGRLLDPYLTSIVQRYSLYIQRQGLPATHEKAFDIKEIAAEG